MTRSAQDKQQHVMPLRDVMSIISDECRDLSAFVDRLQHSLSPALIHLHMDEQSHQDVQSLDALSQRLASLAAYVKEISTLLPETLDVDASNALASVSLSALQRRLQGASAHSDHTAGELELF